MFFFSFIQEVVSILDETDDADDSILCVNIVETPSAV